MKKLAILLFTSTIILSAQTKIKKPELVFDQLIGTWQYGVDKEFESWSKVGHVYYANVYSISNADTTFSEKLKIYKKGAFYYFEQTVVLQKVSNSTTYKLTALDQKLMVFENKNASFPQKIAYEVIPYDELAVVQEGMVQGKLQFIDFAYKKVK